MKRESESVSFIGLGYVGLCTAAVLASRGMKIIGVDIDGEKIAKLAKGETPLHEPRLASVLKSGISRGGLCNNEHPSPGQDRNWGKRRKIREQASEALPANLQGKEDSHCNNESDDSRDHQVCEQRIPRHLSQHNQYHRQHLPTPAIGRCRDRCKGDRL